MGDQGSAFDGWFGNLRSGRCASSPMDPADLPRISDIDLLAKIRAARWTNGPIFGLTTSTYFGAIGRRRGRAIGGVTAVCHLANWSEECNRTPGTSRGTARKRHRALLEAPGDKHSCALRASVQERTSHCHGHGLTTLSLNGRRHDNGDVSRETDGRGRQCEADVVIPRGKGNRSTPS